MGVCNVCNKTYFLYDPVIRCNTINCPEWAHRACAQLKSDNTKKWRCHMHTASEEEVSSESDIGNFTRQDPINRRPANSLHRIPMSSFDNPFLSTPLQNNNNTNPNLPNNSNNNAYTTADNSENTPICAACKRDIPSYFITCKTCNIHRHACCITRDEQGTFSRTDKTFVCFICVNLIKDMRNNLANNTNKNVNNNLNTRNHNAVNNQQHIPINHQSQPCSSAQANMNSNLYRTYRNPTNYNVESSDDESDEEQRPTSFSFAPSRLVTRNENGNNVSNVNNNTNITSENFFFKLQMEKLPEVIDADMSWNVFYITFVETKQFFTASENVRRIQKAIKDDTVKRIGGKGLYNLLTYEKCIEDINKRLKHNLSFLSTEASEIEHHSKIRNENKIKLVEFIDKLRNFCTISEAYKDFSYMNNRRFLATICDIIPFNLRNKWEEKQARLENANIIPSLKHMVRIFDKELPRIEASIRNDKLNMHEKESHKKDATSIEKTNRFYSTNFTKNPTSSITVGKYELQNEKFKCWFHQTNEHYSNKCKQLWEMDGKEVAKLARKNNICTYCGQDKHSPCPNSSKLKCRVDGCEFPHHSLYCYKRLSSKYGNAYNNDINAKETDIESGLNTKNQNNKIDQPSKSKNDPENKDDDEDEKLFERLQNHSYYTNLSADMQSYLKTFQGKQYTHCISNLGIIDNTRNSTDSVESFLSVLVIKLQNQSNYAFLLDSGSSVSLIEEDVANELNLKGPWLPIKLVWSGNMKRYDNMSRVVKTTATNIAYGKKDHQLFFRTVKNLNVSPQKFNAKDIYHQHPKFRPLRLFDHYEISGIIGIDNIFAFEQFECIKSVIQNKYEFYGVQSPLGDYVHGTNMPMSKIYNELNVKKQALSRKRTFAHDSTSDNKFVKLKDMKRESMGSGYDSTRKTERILYEDANVINLLDTDVKKDPNDNPYIAYFLWNGKLHNLPTLESFNMSYINHLIMYDECIKEIQNLLDTNFAASMSLEYNKAHSNSCFNPVPDIHPKNKGTRMIWHLKSKIKNKKLDEFNKSKEFSNINSIPTELMTSVMAELSYENKMISPQLFCLAERDWTYIKSNKINSYEQEPIEWKLPPEYLNKNHFLVGRQFTQSVPSYENIKESKLTNYVEDIKILCSSLWILAAYLLVIFSCEKWTDKSNPLKVDEMVIKADPTIVNNCPIGNEIEFNVGSQQQVRSVTIMVEKISHSA